MRISETRGAACAAAAIGCAMFAGCGTDSVTWESEPNDAARVEGGPDASVDVFVDSGQKDSSSNGDVSSEVLADRAADLTAPVPPVDAAQEIGTNAPDAKVPSADATTCSGGMVACNDKCFDLSKDPLHCGQCATACSAAETCMTGHCAPSCIAGTNACTDLTVAGTVTINAAAASASAAAGTTTITIIGNQVGTFAPKQLVLLHQTQGADSTGVYELAAIASLSGTTLTVAAPLANTYVNDPSRHAQAIGVPQYRNVTVPAGTTLTAPVWNGSTGGILAFVATGTVNVQGAIDMSGRGFRGPHHGCGGQCKAGTQGESHLGPGAVASANNGPGGGASAGGRDCGMGGGGAYGTAGEEGVAPVNFAPFCSGLPPVPGAAGAVAGSADLHASFLLGAAGGEGGGDEDGAYAGGGGSGGGAIVIAAPSVTVSGVVSAAGAPGGSGVNIDATCPSASTSAASCGMGGGGGGAGGAIRIVANSAALGSGLVNAVGGAMGHCNCSNGPTTGSSGGYGRIAVKAAMVSGTTAPPYDAR